jgi:hypothetical protein
MSYLSRKFLLVYFALGVGCSEPVVESLWLSFGKLQTILRKADLINTLMGFLESRGWKPLVKGNLSIKITSSSVCRYFFDLSLNPIRFVTIKSMHPQLYRFEFSLDWREIVLTFSIPGHADKQLLAFPFTSKQRILFSDGRIWEVNDWEGFLEILLKRDLAGERTPISTSIVRKFATIV